MIVHRTGGVRKGSTTGSNGVQPRTYADARRMMQQQHQGRRRWRPLRAAAGAAPASMVSRTAVVLTLALLAVRYVCRFSRPILPGGPAPPSHLTKPSPPNCHVIPMPSSLSHHRTAAFRLPTPALARAARSQRRCVCRRDRRLLLDVVNLDLTTIDTPTYIHVQHPGPTTSTIIIIISSSIIIATAAPRAPARPGAGRGRGGGVGAAAAAAAGDGRGREQWGCVVCLFVCGLCVYNLYNIYVHVHAFQRPRNDKV